MFDILKVEWFLEVDFGWKGKRFGLHDHNNIFYHLIHLLSQPPTSETLSLLNYYFSLFIF